VCGYKNEIYIKKVSKTNLKMGLKMNKIKMTYLLILGLICVAGANNLEVGACEPIKVDMCRQIGYNKTGGTFRLLNHKKTF